MTPAEREKVEVVAFGLLLRDDNPQYDFIHWLNVSDKNGTARSECWHIFYQVERRYQGGLFDDQSRIVKIGSVLS